RQLVSGEGPPHLEALALELAVRRHDARDRTPLGAVLAGRRDARKGERLGGDGGHARLLQVIEAMLIQCKQLHRNGARRLLSTSGPGARRPRAASDRETAGTTAAGRVSSPPLRGSRGMLPNSQT